MIAYATGIIYTTKIRYIPWIRYATYVRNTMRIGYKMILRNTIILRCSMHVGYTIRPYGYDIWNTTASIIYYTSTLRCDMNGHFNHYMVLLGGG